MTHGSPERPSWREVAVRAVRLYFAPFVRVDPIADRAAGPFAQRFQRWALAAAVVAGTGIGISQFLSPQPFTLAIVTGKDEWISRWLPDQSVVHIGPDTNLTVRLDAENRRMDVLRGEVLFEVKHESPSRPFTVYAGPTQTLAVGTQFVVTHRPSGTVKVAMVEGEVRFKHIRSNGAVEERPLTRGEGATVLQDQMDIVKSGEVRRVIWQDDVLYIRGATIGEVVAQLNLREPEEIVIDDARVAATRLSTAYVTPYTRDGFLSLLEGPSLNIRVERRSAVVHLAFKSSSTP